MAETAKTNWTAAQSYAMQATGHNLLLSAAAGSGKTATLTARIIRSLVDEEHPTDISRLLVVTFTRAAAGELKSRISAALSEAYAQSPENWHLSEQLLRIGSASICTIDSFCLSLVRANFQKLSLSSGFRLADETELAVLRHEIMEAQIEEYYDEKTDGSFAALAEHFTGLRDADRLSDVLCDLYMRVSDYPEGLAFLHNSTEESLAAAQLPFFEAKSGKKIASALMAHLNQAIDHLTSSLPLLHENASLEKNYLPAFLSDLEALEKIRSACRDGNYEETRRLITAYRPQKLGSVRGNQKTPEAAIASAVRAEYNRILTKSDVVFFALPEEKINETTEKTAGISEQLFTFLSDYQSRLEEEMHARNVCDFSGIRRLAYRLLVNEHGQPTDIAREISTHYDAIYIDEYQDVDEIQDAIFRAIATPHNRFMVGDIKQSIYGFRGAEPSIFASYRRAYPTVDTTHPEAPENDAQAPGETVFMSENFRCNRPIIDFTNAVCSYLFSVCRDSIGYVAEDDLICAKSQPEDAVLHKVQVAVFLPPDKKKKDAGEDSGDADSVSAETPDSDSENAPTASQGLTDDPELQYITKEINELLHSGKKDDGSPILPGDIAILTRSGTQCRTIAAALDALGIPTSVSAEKDFFENPEVLLVLSLLTAIDNPTRDIPLAGVLRSPLYDFTMDDLVLCRQRTPAPCLYDAVCAMSEGEETDPLVQKCTRFKTSLNRYRSLAQLMPVDKLLQLIYRETCIFAYAGADLDDPLRIRTRKTNLRRLYEYARRFESGSFRGLYNFIQYVEGIIDEGTRIEFGGSTTKEAVSIMTIHKSKGLEFPVCFLSSCGSYFNDTDQAQNTLLFDREAGISLRLPDASGFARLGTPMRLAIAEQQKITSRQEEMRVLYVAMTRARERLYVTAKSRSNLQTVQDNATVRCEMGNATALYACHSYLDWIMTALSAGRGADAYCLTCYPDGSDFSITPDTADTEAVPESIATLPTTELKSILLERFSYRYPFEHLASLPSKISVSLLRPDILDTYAGKPFTEEEDTPSEELLARRALQSRAEAEDSEHRAWTEQMDKVLTRTPVFADKQCTPLTSAERGTATHLFLQFCRFENAEKHGVKNELDRMIEQHFLPRELAEAVNVRQLEKFFASDFYKDLSHAKRVFREKRFYLQLPAAEFTKNPAYAKELGNEHLVIQGVIDLFFEDADGNLVLCDYKTDALSREECENTELARRKLSERHGRQLAYYQKAIKSILGRMPDRTVIYSLPFGEALDIPVPEL